MPEPIEVIGSGFVPGVPGQWANTIVPTLAQKPESPLDSSPASTEAEQETQSEPDSSPAQASKRRQKES